MKEGLIEIEGKRETGREELDPVGRRNEMR